MSDQYVHDICTIHGQPVQFNDKGSMCYFIGLKKNEIKKLKRYVMKAFKQCMMLLHHLNLCSTSC